MLCFASGNYLSKHTVGANSVRPRDSSVKPAACHLLCRGGFAIVSSPEEMPDRAEELLCLP